MLAFICPTLGNTRPTYMQYVYANRICFATSPYHESMLTYVENSDARTKDGSAALSINTFVQMALEMFKK